MTIPYSGKHMVYGIAEETTFGTPVADASAFEQLSCEPFVIEPDVKHRAPNRAFGQLHPDVANVWNDVKGSMPAASMHSIALKNELPLWLYTIFQNVSEGELTPFEKTFTFASATPDFDGANEGCFITLIGKSPVAANSEKLTSCILSQLDLTLSPDADDGNLAFDISLISKGHIYTADPSGTWTKAADSRWNFHDYANCKFNDGADKDLVLNNFKLSIPIGVKIIGSDGSGSFQTYAIFARDPTIELNVLWDANGRALQTAQKNSTEITFTLDWGTQGADGYFSTIMHGIVVTAPPVEDDARGLNATIKGVSDVENTEEILAIVVADDNQRNW